MLSSITPLGERGRASRWPVTVTAHLVGSAVGGTVLGTLLGALGLVLPGSSRVAFVLAVLLAGATIAAETGRLRRFPSWHRQVDEDWLHRYRGWVYGFGYGAQLGTGVVTIVTSPVVHLALALMLGTGNPLAGALTGFTFGVVRALPVLATRSVTTPQRLAGMHRTLERRAPQGRALTGAWSAVVALVSIGLLVGGSW